MSFFIDAAIFYPLYQQKKTYSWSYIALNAEMFKSPVVLMRTPMNNSFRSWKFALHVGVIINWSIETEWQLYALNS